MEELRLQKYISECGVMSRRAAENEIVNGHVTVNGSLAVLGMKINPDTDTVEINGRAVVRSADNGKVYIKLNKPVGYVTTLSDEQGRRCITQLLTSVGTRLYPVGRLDMYSEGLLICTNDGELTNRLTHPSHDISKVYIATLTSHLTTHEIANLREQIVIDDYKLRPFEVELVEYKTAGTTDSTVIKFTLHEGRNREIRRICEYHGYKLSGLKRISIGKITLGDLPVGKWKYLTEEELASLKNA